VDRRRSLPVVLGVRTAVNTVWKARGRQEADDYLMGQLFKNFKMERPRSAVVMPKWNLAFVLHCLSQPPYEPLNDIDFKALTYKTVFLLLLAAARRRGDIHAIDARRVTFCPSRERPTHVIMEPNVGYLPKVLANAEGQSRYSPIVVRAITNWTSDQEDIALCPVRALRTYDDAAAARFPHRRRFFVSLKRSVEAVSKNTISAWMTKLIRQAHAIGTREQCQLYRAHTHEIRAIASSLALQATFSLDSILAAATWSNPTTFTQYYLRDVSGLQGDVHIINPCVVAGTRLG